MKARMIENISRAYMSQTLTIKKLGVLTMCSEKNMSVPVNAWAVIKTRLPNGAWFTKQDLYRMFVISLPRSMLKNVRL
jgi:hypothetical protein